MKKFLFCFVASICLAQAQNPIKTLDQKLEKVTVFLTGAAITRTAKTFVPIGKSELVFKGLSAQLDKQSIQLKAEGRFTVLSINHQSNYLNQNTKQESIGIIQAKKTDFEEKIKNENAMLSVFKQEEIMLSKNQDINGKTAILKAIDLKDAVDFHRARLTEVLLKQLEIRRTIEKLEAEIKKLNAQLTAESTSKDVSTSEVVVTVSAKEASNGTFTLNYFVGNAGWTPSYDLRVQDIAQPIELAYKANVYQYTGEDWRDIKLALSTANPKQSGTAPVLQNWLLGIKNDYSWYYNGQNSNGNQPLSQVYGIVKDLGGEAMPGVTVTLKGTSLGVVTDVNGYYSINIPPDVVARGILLKYSMVGYVNFEKNIYEALNDITLAEDQKTLQEVVVVGYGSQHKRSMTGTVIPEISADMGLASPKKAKSISLEVEETEAPTSKSFEIQTPYTILSDGKVYTVEIKNEEIPAQYQYYCLPKIDKDVFLTAKIIDWEQYNLLPGEASLYFEGTFLGKSNLDLSNRDTLNISLGRDKSLTVNRIRSKNFTQKQFIGSNKSENRGYEISIRNTRKQAVNLMIEDQFPVSKTKEVEVLDKEAPEANTQDETGRITWQLKLEPNKERKIGFKYTVKSPKKSNYEAD